MEDKKIAVILYNLGGPNKKEEIGDFLFNLFYDVLLLPNPFRWILAKFIARMRKKTATEIYDYLGGKSPILEETIKQTEKLEKHVNKDGKYNIKVFTAMQCSNPYLKDVVNKIISKGYKNVISLPLYPQFSYVTSGKAIEKINNLLKKHKNINLTHICCYYDDKKFIKSHVKIIKEEITKLGDLSNYRLLFSAHSLPEIIIKKGDPYQMQIEECYKKIKEAFYEYNLDTLLTYQSKVGRMKWIGPSTEDEIEKASKEKKDLIIIPISFVSEHSETLVELDIEYKLIAEKYKRKYVRIKTLGTQQLYIESLSEMIKLNIKNNSLISKNYSKICSSNFKLCPCYNKNINNNQKNI